MAIDLTTNPGGLFPRLGRIGRIEYVQQQYQAGVPADFQDLFDQYESSLQDVVSATAFEANNYTRTSSQLMGFATTLAQGTLIRMVQADQPSQARSLYSAMSEVIRQMDAAGDTVEENVITLTPTALTGNVGSGVLYTSTKRGDGRVQENTIAETLRIVCTVDSYTGGATIGFETFGVVGAPVLAGTWDYDYPTGSGAAQLATVITPEDDAVVTGNLITNGNFETWTTAVPADTLDDWTLNVGTWGTDAQKSSTEFRGTYALQFLPTAALTEIYQDFPVAGAPLALGSYAFNIWMRALAGTVASGVVTVALTDDTGTILNDAEGVPNSFTVTLNTLTTSWAAQGSVFRVNATPPTTMRIRIKVTTAVAGDSVLVDDAALAAMTAMYLGGPSVAVFSGATPFAGGDGWSVVNTNDQGGASFLATWQTLFQRLFDMRAMGLLLPSSGSPTIANTLITSA